MFSFLKSHSVKILLIGYLLLAVLFAAVLLMDSNLLKEQFEDINSSVKTVKKMQTIVDLIEIARRRTHLSHAMLATDDIFEKDEIWQEITNLAEKFIINNNVLGRLGVNDEELAILKKQQDLYPKVRQNLQKIKDLAFQESVQAESEARHIIIFEIVPLQETIISGFVTILNNMQKSMSVSREQAVSDYFKNEQNRRALIGIIFLASLLVLTWVIKRWNAIENRLHTASLTDGLTGIANRRSFDEKIISECKRGSRDNNPLSLLFIDIDYFKKYNDYYGHQKGDQCLIQAAKIIKGIAHRANDVAARYGGEEFAIILPNTDKDAALAIANHLIDKLNKKKIPHQNSEAADHLTFSIGVATVSPSVEVGWEMLIDMADKGLYASKQNGRNQATLHSKNSL